MPVEYPAQTCSFIDVKRVTGSALVCSDPISYLGHIDKETGVVKGDIEISGECVAGKILVYPTGIGSTVGSYVLLNLVKNGKGPLGIINQEMDTVILSGAIWADIPVAHRFVDVDPIEEFKTGDVLTIDTSGSKVIKDR